MSLAINLIEPTQSKNESYRQHQRNDRGIERSVEKLNELTDNVILVRNICVGTLAVYAKWTLGRRYLIKPFLQTFRFLSNQAKDLQMALATKYG